MTPSVSADIYRQFRGRYGNHQVYISVHICQILQNARRKTSLTSRSQLHVYHSSKVDKRRSLYRRLHKMSNDWWKEIGRKWSMRNTDTLLMEYG